MSSPVQGLVDVPIQALEVFVQIFHLKLVLPREGPAEGLNMTFLTVTLAGICYDGGTP